MKVGLAQINPAVGDFRGNLTKIQTVYQDAVKQDCGLVVFPELALTGCHPRDLLLRRAFANAANKALETLARRIGKVPALVGTITVNPASPGRCLFNTAALLRNGAVEALFHKRLLASHDTFDEDRYFEPGTESAFFDADGSRVGVAIGDDLWNDADFWEDRRAALDPVQDLIAQGCNLIVSPAASAWSLGKDKLRRAMLETMTRDDGLPVLICNMVGCADGVIFDGASIAMSDAGPLAVGASFEEQLLIADIGGGAIAEDSDSTEEGQLLDGLIMGTRDFMAKSGHRKAVVPLDGLGGAVAAVVAARAIEPRNVIAVAVTTKGSDAAEGADNRALAEKLGIEVQTFDAEESLQCLRSLAGKSVTAAPQDAAEDHLPDRLRGLLLALASEKHNAALIVTSDKSDLALGRLAPQGDGAAALAILGDVPKTIVSRLAEFINRDEDLIPPSILTRPATGGSGDGDPPNPSLLDAVVARYVDEDTPIDEIVSAGFDRSVVRDLARKIDQAEALRQQGPPCLKVTSRSFGPERRMPIAQRFSEW
ncbi:MAG: hypothetical protein IT577_23235 [Verrucomicrobiae bacterium]|nr:hypothetical protein [Verrucomicrobiae bacterium]